jgi:hypothetical protein
MKEASWVLPINSIFAKRLTEARREVRSMIPSDEYRIG